MENMVNMKNLSIQADLIPFQLNLEYESVTLISCNMLRTYRWVGPKIFGGFQKSDLCPHRVLCPRPSVSCPRLSLALVQVPNSSEAAYSISFNNTRLDVRNQTEESSHFQKHKTLRLAGNRPPSKSIQAD